MVTLWNRFYIFSGKIKLPIVEQIKIICDAMEYDSYSTGEVILPPGRRQKGRNSLLMGACS